MIYYRLALQDRQTTKWNWKTTALTSLHAVFQLLRIYSTLPQDSIRVFTASSKEALNEMLRQENNASISGSVTAAQFLQERKLTSGSPELRATEQLIRPDATVTIPSSMCKSLSAASASDNISLLDKKRLEIECGPGGDHDVPYCFTLPVSMPAIVAWICLQTRIQVGELAS